MKKVVVLGSFVLLALGLAACGNGGKKAAEAQDTVSRRYVGTVPAADCPGIVMDLTLRNAAGDSLAGDFALSMTYLEAEDGKDVTFDEAGAWSALKGVPADGAAVYYQLVGAGDRPDTMNFLWLGDSVVMLGAGLERAPSGLNYTLVLQK